MRNDYDAYTFNTVELTKSSLIRIFLYYAGDREYDGLNINLIALVLIVNMEGSIIQIIGL